MRIVFIKKANTFFWSLIIAAVAIAVSIFLLYDKSQPSEYKYLFLLPMCFAILNIVFCDLYCAEGNLGIYAIIFLEFFRLVLIPLFLGLGDYYSAMINTRSRYLSSATFLMIYEAICVFVTIGLTYRKDTYIASQNIQKLRSNALNKIILLLLFFLIAVTIFFPQSTTTFKSIFDFGAADFTTWAGTSVSSKYETGTINRIVGTLFTLVFSWIRYLFPIAVIIWCRKHITNRFIAICISLIPIVLQMMFITATIMDGILCGFILLVVLGKVYPKQRNFLFGMSILAFFLVIGFYFISRYLVRFSSYGNLWRFISENAVAYVGGIDNVAATFNLPNEGKWSTFFFNIYGAIPFNSTLFGLKGDKLAAVFNVVNGRVDGQIPPTIGVGRYYYGSILAPLESIIFTRLACKYGRRASVENNIWKYSVYLLIAIMMAMEFTTYNAAIVLNYITTLLLPLLLLSHYTNDFEFEVFEETNGD